MTFYAYIAMINYRIMVFQRKLRKKIPSLLVSVMIFKPRQSIPKRNPIFFISEIHKSQRSLWYHSPNSPQRNLRSNEVNRRKNYNDFVRQTKNWKISIIPYRRRIKEDVQIYFRLQPHKLCIFNVSNRHNAQIFLV